MGALLRSLVAAGLLAAGGAGPAKAAEAKAALHIESPWARASLGRSAAAYLTIVNAGSGDDRLIGAETPVAKSATLHDESMTGGVMRMRPVEALDLPPNRPVTLAPGGLHIMLVGLTHPLKEGEEVPLTLRFEHAGAVTIQVPVQAAAAMGPAVPNRPKDMQGMPGMSKGGMGAMGHGMGNDMGHDMGQMQHGAPSD